MGSGHNHPPHSHAHAHNNLLLAFMMNLTFAIVELFGGLWIGSIAILSNALHDAGDAMSLGLGYFLQRRSEEGPSEQFSYGMRRLSLLSAFISGLVICGGGVFIVYESLQKLMNPGEPKALGMLIFAVVGIAINGFAAWRLGHGETHNEKVLSWHLIEDTLGWVAVLIGAICIMLFDWRWVDAALGIAISIFVSFNVIRQLLHTAALFLQGNPDPGKLREFRETVMKFEDVMSLHDLHFWSLDGAHHVLSMHVVTSLPLTQSSALKLRIRKESYRLGECHLTIEVEAPNDHCHDNCDDEHDHDHHHGHDHK
jgi:cobalt-zinc-cadmium efflux system protein